MASYLVEFCKIFPQKALSFRGSVGLDTEWGEGAHFRPSLPPTPFIVNNEVFAQDPSETVAN